MIRRIATTKVDGHPFFSMEVDNTGLIIDNVKYSINDPVLFEWEVERKGEADPNITTLVSEIYTLRINSHGELYALEQFKDSINDEYTAYDYRIHLIANVAQWYEELLDSEKKYIEQYGITPEPTDEYKNSQKGDYCSYVTYLDEHGDRHYTAPLPNKFIFISGLSGTGEDTKHLLFLPCAKNADDENGYITLYNGWAHDDINLNWYAYYKG